MKQKENTSNKIQIRAYSVKEVANLYGISGKILKKWLDDYEKEIGNRKGHFYNPKQMKIIFDKLGAPEIHMN
jgi:transposase-like protein